MSTARPIVVFNAYFSGSGHSITDTHMLASILYRHDTGRPIEDAKEDSTHIKIGKSGCGVDHTTGLGNWLGGLYGVGIGDHVAEVETQVRKRILQGKKVVLNVYGHSRGGVTALLLAKKLGQVSQDLLEINLALHDPVPGNYIVIAKLDVFNLTLANQAMDLSACKNIKRVLALYPSMPLLSILAHSPLFPKYPSNCRVSQDVIPGGHARAQRQSRVQCGPESLHLFGENSYGGCPSMAGAFVSFVRFWRFFTRYGALSNFKNTRIAVVSASQANIICKAGSALNSQDLVSLYEYTRSSLNVSITRSAHSYQKTMIESIVCDESVKYVNLHHQKLVQQSSEYKKEPNNVVSDKVALTITPNTSHRRVPDRVDYQSAAVRILFQDLMNETKNHLSNASQVTKGVWLQKYITELQQDHFKFDDKLAVINALRNLAALILQRDRYQYSIFTTTRSGEAFLKLLNDPKYQVFANLIRGSSESKLRYRDLRSFVINENRENYFNAKHKESAYAIHQNSLSIKTDQLENYFSRLRLVRC